MPRLARNTDYKRLRHLKECIGDEGYISRAVGIIATDLSIRLVQRDEVDSVSEVENEEPGDGKSRTFHGE
ncbi:MAG: hypothetical protein EA383_04110 [Spirochaetaceae bacterium]|nr:MAG: hypothetical protein EA383_04110 [Spirochaetaceae bacterium]